jgi:hypothetical protein
MKVGKYMAGPQPCNNLLGVILVHPCILAGAGSRTLFTRRFLHARDRARCLSRPEYRSA